MTTCCVEKIRVTRAMDKPSWRAISDRHHLRCMVRLHLPGRAAKQQLECFIDEQCFGRNGGTPSSTPFCDARLQVHPQRPARHTTQQQAGDTGAPVLPLAVDVGA